MQTMKNIFSPLHELTTIDILFLLKYSSVMHSRERSALLRELQIRL